ncbi:MAG: hypothetical protein ACRDFT_01550 [bacterium]
MDNRTLLLAGPLACLAAILTLAGCVTTSRHPEVTVARSDDAQGDRARRFGEGAISVMTNPLIDDQVRMLFGVDWKGGAPGGTRASAPEFFTASAPPRLVEIGGVEYVAVTGCRALACGRDRGLLLIRTDGNQFLARLDEGGFSHYYGHGSVDMHRWSRAGLNAAWDELEERRWVSHRS